MKIGEIKKRLILLQTSVLVLMVLVIMMSVALVLLKDRINDWESVIEFLKIWIQQNDLRITPPTKA